MDAIHGNDGAKAINLSDFRVSSTPDDDSSVLLANTNRLLGAVGISAKRIESTEELSRVASSLFVAVYESLFHQKISGVVRNPRTRDDYERNAQLVIDSLSDQIQLDLKHITGRSIVSGDLRVLSNLVHILVRIVSLTSQESLTSYDSSANEKDGRGNKYRGILGSDTGDSISTRESEQPAVPRDPYYLADAARMVRERAVEGPFGAHNGVVSNEDLKRSLAKMDQLLQIERKMELARRRRESNLHLRGAASRAANVKQAQASRDVAQRKWAEDVERERRAFALRRSTAEQVLLRKIYKGLLTRVVKWKLDEHNEERAMKAQIKEQTAWQVNSLQTLFEERLQALRDDASELRAAGGGTVKGELELAEDLLRSVEVRNRALLQKERARLEHQRDKELLRRSEAHESLMAMLNVTDWKEMLRAGAAHV